MDTDDKRISFACRSCRFESPSLSRLIEHYERCHSPEAVQRAMMAAGEARRQHVLERRKANYHYKKGLTMKDAEPRLVARKE